MRYSFIILVSFFFGLRASCQDSIKVRATLISDKVFLEGWLEQFNTDKPMVLHFTIRDRRIVFNLPHSVQPGVYRLHLDSTNQRPFVDFIINGIEDEIVFDITLNNIGVRPAFNKSIENKVWYDYLKIASKYENRLDGLFNYLSVFHDKSIDRLVIKTYNKERKKYYKNFYKFCYENKSIWASLLVKNRPYYYSNLREKPVERDYIRRLFFWEGIDTSNPKLINTPLYGELIDLYFDMYFINSKERYTSAQKEYLVKKEIDDLIVKFSKNLVSKVFIRNYLKTYFIRLKNQNLIDYVHLKEG